MGKMEVDDGRKVLLCLILQVLMPGVFQAGVAVREQFTVGNAQMVAVVAIARLFLEASSVNNIKKEARST